MRDVLWRPYEPSDAPALTELMNLLNEHAGGHPYYTAEELGSLIATLVADPATDSSMAFTPDGVLVAAGFTTTPPRDGFKLYLTGGVHPQWRGRGLGRKILARHLARAVEIRRAAAPDRAWIAEAPKILAGDRDAARLLPRFGMRATRYWFEMAAPTSHVPAAPIPDGLRMEPYDAAHEAAVHAAHMEAFSDNYEFQARDLDSWVTITVRSQSFLPELSLLAVDERSGEMAGYLLTYLHAEPGRVYVGELGVRRPWRGRGLASALLARVLDAAGHAGNKEVTLSVDAESPTGAVGVYERAGFTVESSTITFAMPLTD